MVIGHNSKPNNDKIGKTQEEMVRYQVNNEGEDSGRDQEQFGSPEINNQILQPSIQSTANKNLKYQDQRVLPDESIKQIPNDILFNIGSDEQPPSLSPIQRTIYNNT